MKKTMWVLLVAVSFLILSCNSNHGIDPSISNNYDFLEIRINSFAKKLESGKRSENGYTGRRSYSFDKSSGSLELYNLNQIDKEKLNKAKLICVTEYMLPWELPHGVYSNSSIIESLPGNVPYLSLETFKNENIKIIEVSDNGSIRLSFREENFLINELENVSFIREYETMNDFGKFFIRDTVSITLYEKQDKNKIYLSYFPL